jgi:hypothetical protein
MKTNIIRNFTLGLGVAAALFVLMLPPLRGLGPGYIEPNLARGRFEQPWHISRFRWSPGQWATNPEGGFVARTEVDGGELLRELAFVIVLFGAGCLWMPKIIELGRAEYEDAKAELAAPTVKTGEKD